MSLKKRLAGAGLALGLAGSLTASAFAQQPSQAGQPQQGERAGRQWGRGGGGREGMGFMRILRDLNLTDQQNQQIQAVADKYRQTNKPLFDEMRQLRQQKEQGTLGADSEARLKALREQLQESNKSMRAEILNYLTPDQRTQLEQKEKEFKEQHRGGREHRGAQSQQQQ